MAAPTVGNFDLANAVSGPMTVNVTCAAGRGLLVFAYGPTASSPVGVSGGGNTFIAGTSSPYDESNNATTLASWYVKSVASLNPTLTFTETGGSNDHTIGWVEILGADTTTFVDVQSGKGTADGGYGSNAVITTAADDLVIACAFNAFSGTAFGIGAGYSIFKSYTATRNSALASATPGAGSTNPNWTHTSLGNGGTSYTIGIKAAASASTKRGRLALTGVGR